MEIKELEIRINKCKETITKKENLINKRKKAIEKKIKDLQDLGYKGSTYEELCEEKEKYRENNFNEPIFQEGYGIIYDISSYSRSIEDAKKAIENEKIKLNKYLNMLESEKEKDDLINNLPENIKEFVNELVDNWNEYDKNKKRKIHKSITEWEENKNISYKEFDKEMERRFGRNYWDFSRTSDEQIEKDNKEAGRILILDFINRVSFKVGKIESFDQLSVNRDNQGFAILNGVIKGRDGEAKVSSILAGGYNIQKLHIRVLVK